MLNVVSCASVKSELENNVSDTSSLPNPVERKKKKRE